MKYNLETVEEDDLVYDQVIELLKELLKNYDGDQLTISIIKKFGLIPIVNIDGVGTEIVNIDDWKTIPICDIADFVAERYEVLNRHMEIAVG